MEVRIKLVIKQEDYAFKILRKPGFLRLAKRSRELLMVGLFGHICLQNPLEFY